MTAGSDRVDVVVAPPRDERGRAEVDERRDRDALDPVPEHRCERRGGAGDAERPLPLLDERRGERRLVRPPGGCEPAAEEPVPVGGDPVEARVPGRQQQVREPGRAAAAGKRVSVEEHDARDPAWGVGGHRDGHRRAEGVADEQRPPQAELPRESANEAGPPRERERATPLGVPEGRQVERVDPVRAPEPRPDLVPDPGRLDEAAEQDHRGAVRPPGPVGELGPVHPGVRARVERGRGGVPPGGREVEDERRERQRHHDGSERDPDPPQPALQPGHERRLRAATGLSGRCFGGRGRRGPCSTPCRTTSRRA